MASARAIATRCCWPPESWRGWASSLSPRPTRSSSARPRSVAAATGSLLTRTGASMTFSRAVMWGKRLNPWKTMPISERL